MSIIMPIIRRTRVCSSAWDDLDCLGWLWFVELGRELCALSQCTVHFHSKLWTFAMHCAVSQFTHLKSQLHTPTASKRSPELHMRQWTCFFSWWWA